MSLRLRLYALGARMTVRPLFGRTRDPLRDAARLDRLASMTGLPVPGSMILRRPVGGRPGRWIEARGADPTSLVLYFHGGGYLAGSSRTHAPMLSRISAYAACSICAQDYRLSPVAPFPAAVEDALAAWDDLLARGYAPDRIVLGGDSAGGGLMLSLLAQLCQRGTPPAAAFAMSPWTDLGCSGGTMATNAATDCVLPADRLAEAAQAYLKGAEPQDPLASPLFADFPDPPPVLLQVGSPEVLEDDTYRMANRLRQFGAEVSVQTWTGAPHVFQLAEAWVPEARAALQDIATFIQNSLSPASR